MQGVPPWHSLHCRKRLLNFPCMLFPGSFHWLDSGHHTLLPKTVIWNAITAPELASPAAALLVIWNAITEHVTSSSTVISTHTHIQVFYWQATMLGMHTRKHSCEAIMVCYDVKDDISKVEQTWVAWCCLTMGGLWELVQARTQLRAPRYPERRKVTLNSTLPRRKHSTEDSGHTLIIDLWLVLGYTSLMLKPQSWLHVRVRRDLIGRPTGGHGAHWASQLISGSSLQYSAVLCSCALWPFPFLGKPGLTHTIAVQATAL